MLNPLLLRAVNLLADLPSVGFHWYEPALFMVYESFLMYQASDLPQMYLLHLGRCKKGSTLKVSKKPEERDVRKVILKLAVGLGWPARFLLDMWSSVPLGSAIMMWKILANCKIG